MALTDNILAYWNLNDNGSGGVSLVDSTGNGYALTDSYDVALGTGIIAGGSQYNGFNALSNASFPAMGLGDFSVSTWVKTDSTPSYQSYYSTRSEDSFTSETAFSITITPSKHIVIYAGYFVIGDFLVPIPVDTWTNVAIVRIAGVVNIYLNGTLATSASWPSDLTETTLSLGSIYGVQAENLVGGIDEVGVWNRALTSTEITQLYNSGIGYAYPFKQFYFSGGDLSTLGNWWQDDAFTIPSVALPDSTDVVSILSAVTSGTATYVFATITANIGSAVTITATIGLTNAVNSGTLIGTTTLNGTSSNAGTITGVVVLNDTSFNSGSITGNVTFNENSYQGTSGAITGNANVYYPAQYPIGGSVSGTITYIWPYGTGLWGGDVWIDGSLSFIIPDPSDVRSGVEYGLAEDPYVGTYSGGGGGIDLARLIGLPPFVSL